LREKHWQSDDEPNIARRIERALQPTTS
jgi:hypothetical protein